MRNAPGDGERIGAAWSPSNDGSSFSGANEIQVAFAWEVGAICLQRGTDVVVDI